LPGARRFLGIGTGTGCWTDGRGGYSTPAAVCSKRAFSGGSASQCAYGEATTTNGTDNDNRRMTTAHGAGRIGAHNHEFQPAAQRSKIGNARGTPYCSWTDNECDAKEKMDV